MELLNSPAYSLGSSCRAFLFRAFVIYVFVLQICEPVLLGGGLRPGDRGNFQASSIPHKTLFTLLKRLVASRAGDGKIANLFYSVLLEKH
jgi:hypothetical protein